MIAFLAAAASCVVGGDDFTSVREAKKKPICSPPLGSAADSELIASVNLESFAADVVHGLANVTIVGDSINNDGQSGFMFSGYMLEWRPLRWRQVHPPINANGISTGCWLEVSGAANYQLVRPGQTPLHASAFAGTHLRSMRTIRGSGWSGRAMSNGFNFNSFNFEAGMLRSAGADRSFLRHDGAYRHRLMIIGDDQPTTRNRWEIRSRNSEIGTGWTASTGSIEFTGPDEPGLRWFDHVIDGSPSGRGHIGSGLFSSGDPFDSETQVGLAGVIITDLDTPIGLGLTYVGQGGWRSENHRYRYGSTQSPDVSGPWGQYPAGYSDDAIRRHMRAHETSHVMIWIGSNNAGVDSEFPVFTAADVRKIMERYREAHQVLEDEDPDLQPLQFLLISPYTFKDAGFYEGYAEQLRLLAGDDVAFIDLHGLVKESFGSYDDWSSELLADGVHPNLNGARTFAAMIWNELVRSVGPAADLDRNGLVDAADFGLLLLDWGRTGHPGPADLDRDGQVDSADIGLLLLEWATTAD